MYSQKKLGAFFLYASTILNTFISIFLTPFILGVLGDSEYGIYRTISAFTGQLAIISFGIGTLTSIYVARYSVEGTIENKKEEQNFLFLAINVSILISIIILCVGFILYFFIDDIYGKNLAINQVYLMKKLYILLVINIALYLFRDIFVGIVNGKEKFIYSNSVKFFKLLIRAIAIVIVLSIGLKSIGLVIIDLIISIIIILCDIIYCFIILKVKIKFFYFDKFLFKTMFSFSIAIFLQAIVNQVNQNLDSVILGAMIIPERVTIYSLALTLYISFNSLSTAISSLFTPEASRMVAQKSNSLELIKFCIKVSRYQLLLTALLIGGFIAVGKQFIIIWVGIEKIQIYYIALILIIPMSVVNLLSGANSVLDAYMKRMGRSIILLITAIINVISSIIMIKFIDYWGAAFGTAISVVLGQIIFMSFYYKKVFKFNMIYFLLESSKGILLCALVALICTIPLNIYITNNIVLLTVKGSVYVGIYMYMLVKVGLTNIEKKVIFGRFIK